LTYGRELKPVTAIERMSSTMTEKTKSFDSLDKLRNLSITPSDDGHMGLIAREAEELQ
jgi:hypothetical protein